MYISALISIDFKLPLRPVSPPPPSRYVSCIFTCPYDGPTPFEAVLRCVRQLLEIGCYEVSLGDTLGVGVPSQTTGLLTNLINEGIPVEKLAGHFHDTYGQALANIWASYQTGVRTFDASVGRLGGCFYAPGAKGNVATEDVVYMFENAGVTTGVDLISLTSTGVWISTQLKKKNDSRAGSAIVAKVAKSVYSSKTKTKTKPPQSSLQCFEAVLYRLQNWLGLVQFRELCPALRILRRCLINI